MTNRRGSTIVLGTPLPVRQHIAPRPREHAMMLSSQLKKNSAMNNKRLRCNSLNVQRRSLRYYPSIILLFQSSQLRSLQPLPYVLVNMTRATGLIVAYYYFKRVPLVRSPPPYCVYTPPRYTGFGLTGPRDHLGKLMSVNLQEKRSSDVSFHVAVKLVEWRLQPPSFAGYAGR